MTIQTGERRETEKRGGMKPYLQAEVHSAQKTAIGKLLHMEQNLLQWTSDKKSAGSRNLLFFQLTIGFIHFFIRYKDQIMYKGR